MCRTDVRSRSRFRRLALCLTAAILLILPMRTSAIILMEVLGMLTLFEVEGPTFVFYSTSDRTRLRIRDTDADWSGIVNVEGQQESSPELKIYAFSRGDPLQRVCIEIDVAPLRGRATERFFLLNATGISVGPAPVTDRALAALEGPLSLGFELEAETRRNDTSRWFAVYRLRSVQGQ